MQHLILHIDMNSYFASVEQQANPFLRGKPVGVCAYLSENGCVIASSAEAKRYGVKTGMRMREARRLHPPTIFLQNDPPKYRSVTERIFSILAEYTDQIEPYSIDEAFLDLTGHVKNIDEAALLGATMNQRIKKEVGAWLRSSIGIAETRFFAKLVSDTGPKDSVTALSADEAPDYLKNLDLEEIWGIAKATRRRLETLGIATPLEFRNAAPMRVLAALGRHGYCLWASLNGHEMHETALVSSPPKSIGHSYCLAEKTKDPAKLARVLMKLCEKTGRRLRAANFEARSISTAWRTEDGRGAHHTHRLPIPLFDSFDIFRESWKLLHAEAIAHRVTLLAVSVSSFTPPTLQCTLPLYRGEIERGVRTWSRKRSVACALDAVNNKWGEYTIARGAMFGTDKNAQDRIGYRKTLPVPMREESLQCVESEY